MIFFKFEESASPHNMRVICAFLVTAVRSSVDLSSGIQTLVVRLKPLIPTSGQDRGLERSVTTFGLPSNYWVMIM